MRKHDVEITARPLRFVVNEDASTETLGEDNPSCFHGIFYPSASASHIDNDKAILLKSITIRRTLCLQLE